jgi:hypothetical protein
MNWKKHKINTLGRTKQKIQFAEFSRSSNRRNSCLHEAITIDMEFRRGLPVVTYDFVVIEVAVGHK